MQTIDFFLSDALQRREKMVSVMSALQDQANTLRLVCRDLHCRFLLKRDEDFVFDECFVQRRQRVEKEYLDTSQQILFASKILSVVETIVFETESLKASFSRV